MKRFNAAKKEWGFGQLISLATFQNTNQGYMCRILVLLVLRSSSLNQLSNRRKSHSYQTHQTMFSLGRFFVFSSLEDKFYYSDDFLVGDRYWLQLFYSPYCTVYSCIFEFKCNNGFRLMYNQEIRV